MSRKARARAVAGPEPSPAAWWMALGLALGLALAMPGLARGQTEVPANPAPPGSPETVPEEIDRGPPIGSTQGGTSLSEELAETGGVIPAPPVGDREIVEEPPPAELFPTPVIPPGAVTPKVQPAE